MHDWAVGWPCCATLGKEIILDGDIIKRPFGKIYEVQLYSGRGGAIYVVENILAGDNVG